MQMNKTKKLLIVLTPLLVFLVGYVAFAFLTYKDFGITSDEEVGFRDAGFLYSYYTKVVTFKNTIIPLTIMREGLLRDQPLLSDHNRIYPMIINLLSPNGTYEEYHFLSILLFSFLFIFSYIAIYHSTKSKVYSFIFLLILFFVPRMMGDVPANQKDIPFLMFYFISLCLIYLLGSVKSSKFIYLPLGISIGLAQSSRMAGMSLYLIFVFYSLYLLIPILLDKKEKKQKKKIFLHGILNISLDVCVIFLIGLLVHAITQPYLGANIPAHLYALAVKGTSYPEWDGAILYKGIKYAADKRPWDYLFVWLGITTPLYLIFFSAVSLVFIKKLIKNAFYFINILSFALSIILYLTLHPVIYNGLRHYLFLLPSLCVFALFGFKSLYESLKKPSFKYILICVALLGFGKTIWDMSKLYPYYYIYFNEVVGGVHGAQGKFDLDYWGTSYSEAAKWVSKDFPNFKTTGDTVLIANKIYSCGGSFPVGYYKNKDMKTLDYYKFPNTPNPSVGYLICDKPDAVISNRWEIVYQVTRDGAVLNTVKRLKSQ
jgi:hypothetical protein